MLTETEAKTVVNFLGGVAPSPKLISKLDFDRKILHRGRSGMLSEDWLLRAAIDSGEMIPLDMPRPPAPETEVSAQVPEVTVPSVVVDEETDDLKQVAEAARAAAKTFVLPEETTAVSDDFVVPSDWDLVKADASVYGFHNGAPRLGTYKGKGQGGTVRIKFKGDKAAYRKVAKKDVQVDSRCILEHELV